MQVKTFTGTSTKEIMARIKTELGPEAIILSNQKHTREGRTVYEIMAALDIPAPQPEPPAPVQPAPLAEEASLREEWHQLRRQLMGLLKPQMDVDLLTPKQQLVFEYLEREGVRSEVLLDLWKKFRRAADAPVLSILSGMVGIRPWMSTDWEHKFHFLAGPSGSGKTSTALRLALAAKKDRRARVMIVNADKAQGKGRLYLRHYTDLSGLSYMELDSPDQWSQLASRTAHHDLVFIDLPGLPGDQKLDRWLHEASAGHIPAAHAHLVLSPLYSTAQVDALISGMHTDMNASVIWTKLDEACSFGEILNQAVVTKLPVSLFSVGSELKNSLVEPREQDIWKLLLRRELPAAKPETNQDSHA